jgi:RNase H-fold protein (predicted Holliday junction resolvase)
MIEKNKIFLHLASKINKMNCLYLGIDFGESYVGFAISNGSLAKPLEVFKYPQGNYEILKAHIFEVIKKNNPVFIVIGIPSNESISLKIKNIFFSLIFGESELRKKIIWANEDFSTKEAILLKKRKRRIREDSIAASIILENYINNIVN